jgi:hypothetical protein
MIDAKVDLEAEVRSVQNLLKNNLALKDSSKMHTNYINGGILEEVRNYPIEIVKECLGDFGFQLLKFIEFFDLSHPGVFPLVCELENATKLSEELCSYLKVAKAAYDIGAKNVLELMSNRINDKASIKKFCNQINLRPPIRAIKDPNVRKRIRAQAKLNKRSGNIHYSEFNIDTNNWSNVPNSLAPYVRFNAGNLKDTARKKMIADRFRELGMDGQARVYDNVLLGANQKKNKSFKGFYPTEIHEMGTVLAKVHGFVLNMDDTPFLSPHHNPEMLKFLMHAVCISPKYIKEICRELKFPKWETEDPSSFMEVIMGMGFQKEWLTIAKRIIRHHPTFCNRMRVYMITGLERLISPELKMVVDSLEAFQDYGNLALFDYFMVMVPTITINDLFYNQVNQAYFIRDSKGIEVFINKESAEVYLDVLMMRLGVVRPLLIGQKDDQHYPITYW